MDTAQNKPKSNLKENGLHNLNFSIEKKNIIIQKADKGNTVVFIDKDAYKKKMKAINPDRFKFEKCDIEEEKYLNFIVNKEKRQMEIIKPLYEKSCFTKNQVLKL